MIRLIFHIILLAVLAVFVALNVSYTTTIDLFGYLIEDISTVAVVLVSLIAGVLYSFIYYVLNLLRKSGIRRAKKKQKEVKEKEKLLDHESKKKGKGDAASAAEHHAVSSAEGEAAALEAPNSSGPTAEDGADVSEMTEKELSSETDSKGKPAKKGGLFSRKKKKKG